MVKYKTESQTAEALIATESLLVGKSLGRRHMWSSRRWTRSGIYIYINYLATVLRI